MKTLAVVCPARGEVALREIEVGEPSAGEIQVRVQASLISPGTERAMILNLATTPGQFPFEPGYCAAGVVEKVGSGVAGYATGDRVACFLIGHRQLGNVAAQWAVAIPDGIPFEKAAFLPLGQISTQGVRKTRLELGERALVLGLGIIGQLAVQITRLSGGMPVIGADRVPGRLEIARKGGADVVLDTREADWMSRAAEPRVVVESTGMPEAVPLALQVAGRFARVSLLGSTRGDSTVNFYRDVHRKGLSIVGAHAMFSVPQLESRPGNWTWRDDAGCFMSLLQQGRVNIDLLLTDVVSFRQAESVYKEILAWKVDRIGTVIRWA